MTMLPLEDSGCGPHPLPERPIANSSPSSVLGSRHLHGAPSTARTDASPAHIVQRAPHQAHGRLLGQAALEGGGGGRGEGSSAHVVGGLGSFTRGSKFL